MKRKMRFWLVGLAMLSALALAACGGGSTTTGTTGGTTGGDAGAATLDVTTEGEQLLYKPATLTVKSGAAVTITFKNGSAVQQHNLVLIKGGDDVATKVSTEGITAGTTKGYIPDDMANIIANSKLLAGNESGTVTFTAPAPGTYSFICTFPGHYAAGMKGTLTVS